MAAGVGDVSVHVGAGDAQVELVPGSGRPGAQGGLEPFVQADGVAWWSGAGDAFKTLQAAGGAESVDGAFGELGHLKGAVGVDDLAVTHGVSGGHGGKGQDVRHHGRDLSIVVEHAACPGAVRHDKVGTHPERAGESGKGACGVRGGGRALGTGA